MSQHGFGGRARLANYAAQARLGCGMHTPQTLAKEQTMSDMREDMLRNLAK
jgi:hypothetical protein